MFYVLLRRIPFRPQLICQHASKHTKTSQPNGNPAVTTTYYAGAQEADINNGQATVKTYWPYGLGVEIDQPDSNTSELHWSHHDRLGSIISISDSSGNLKETLAYDSWGKRRTTDGSATPDNLDGQVDNKGYTGHEMLDQLDLVHMNGRIYDPLMARFLSADPLTQDPAHSQSYNRYTYLWNNPTNLTDPTGFEAGNAGDNGLIQTEEAKKKDCDLICQGVRRMMDVCQAMGGNCGIIGDTSAAKGKDESVTGPKQAAPPGGAANTNTVGPGSNYIPGLGPAPPLGNGCPVGMQCVVVSGQRFENTEKQRAYLDAGDFLGYWRSRYTDSHDPVARTALIGWRSPQSVNRPSKFEKVASGVTWWNLERNLTGTDVQKADTMQKIGLDLARAHAEAVDQDLKGGIGIPGLLSPDQVARYHWQVFSKYGVSRSTFGGTMVGLPAGLYAPIWCEGCDGKN